jgi:hypothetical protein
MNANIRKEVRSLLPTFGVTIVVTILLPLFFIFISNEDPMGIVLFVFGGCCAMMAACSFGNEFQSRTMSLLLTQPAARNRIWRDKMTVLAAALGIACAAILLCTPLILGLRVVRSVEYLGLASMLIGIAVIALCSGPFLTLSIKNIIGAMGAIAALPFALFMLIMSLDYLVSWLCSHPEQPFFGDSFEADPYRFIAPLLAIYCSVLYWLGYKMFAGFQLIDTQAQEIALPAKLEAGLAPISKLLMPGYTGPMASLIRKEIQLHRTSFIIAGAACVLLAGVAVMHEIHPSEITTGVMFACVVMCVFLVPLVTGAVAIAEERSWGMTGWQLTQPPSVFKQWTIKMLVAFVISVVLGIALPAVMLTCMRFLLAGSVQALSLADFNSLASGTALLLYILVLSLVIYASSISTNSMRAIIMFLGLLTGIGLIVGTAVNVIHIYYEALGQWVYDSFLMHPAPTLFEIFRVTTVIGACFAVTMLWYLTLFNFRNPEQNSRRRTIQLSLIGLSTFGLILVIIGMLAYKMSFALYAGPHHASSISISVP